MAAYENFTAENFRNSSTKLEQIEMHVHDILRCLHTEMKDAHDMGQSYIDSTMSNSFSIPHMRLEDAVIKIHYRIVSSLVSRQFRVYIEDQDTRTRIIVAWITKEDIEQLKKEKQFLEYCKVPFSKRKNT